MGNLLVSRVAGTWIKDSDKNEDMLEMRSDVFWCKSQRSRFLKDNSHDVVPNMAFAKQLERNGSTWLECPENKINTISKAGNECKNQVFYHDV